MALSSMTGFARGHGTSGGYAWAWEMKSVNAKGLDLRLRLPPGWDAIESALRARAGETIARGTLHATLNVDREGVAPVVKVNDAVLQAVIATLKSLQGRVEAAPARLDGILSIKGVIEVTDADEREEERIAAQAAALKGFDQALAGLTAMTRVQYALLPMVFVAGALAVERGSIRSALRSFRLTWGVFAAPVAALVMLGPSRVLGYYNSVIDLHVQPGAIAHWIATDSMLLVYCAGWVLVPGAVIGFGYALARPRSREEAAFGGITAGLLLILFAETSLYASNGSPRFQERYFMALLPLVLPWFGLYLNRGRPARLPLALLAVALLAVSARVPLAPYSVGDNKQDSPFLLGVFRLEHAIGAANGSLAIAIAAAILSVLAVGIAWRARLAMLALPLSLVIAVAASAGSASVDRHVADSVRRALLPPDARWLDHSGLRHVLLIQTPATPHAGAHEQLFWNRSVDEVLFYEQATPIDAFGYKHVTNGSDGRFLLGRHTVRAPLAISEFAVRMRLRGAEPAGRGGGYELWRPLGTPRAALFVGGLYHDGWLAQAGHLILWPDHGRFVRGTLRWRLSLPIKTKPTALRFDAPNMDRQLVITPGSSRTVVLPVNGRGPWRLTFRTKRPGYLADGRAISVKADTPVFTAAG